MNHFIRIAIVLIIGLGGGGFSAKWALDAENGFGSVKFDQWTAWPLAGSVDADPYTKARVARDGIVPLGAAEGLAFHLTSDVFGRPLRRECPYTLIGTVPQARIWTLSAQDKDRNVIPAHAGGINTVFSQSILRARDSSFKINIGKHPAPYNWMTVTGTGPMRLVLRLYDTPITGSVGLVEPVMPKLISRDCSK